MSYQIFSLLLFTIMQNFSFCSFQRPFSFLLVFKVNSTPSPWMKFPTLCSLHTFKSKSDISLLSHQSSLQRKHRYSSWQVYGAVKSNNTMEEWLFRSWESAPILWAGVCWYSLSPFTVSIPVQRLDIKNILLGTKSHSWILRVLNLAWTSRKKNTAHAEIKQVLLISCQAPCRVNTYLLRYKKW